MASVGGMAALLQIGIRTDATRAAQEIRRFESQLKGTARTAQQAAAAQQRANASYKQAAQYLGTSERAARRAAQANQTLSKETGKTGTVLGRVGKAAVGAAAAYVGIGAARTAVDTTMDLTKSTLTLHKSLGITTKTAWGLGVALKARDADSTRVAMAFKTFASQMNAAASGTQSSIDKFKQLGITGNQLQRDLQNPNKMLFDVAEGLKNLGSGAARTDLTAKLFGRSWQALRPIMQGGAQGLRDALQAVEQNGAGLEGGIGKLKEMRKAQINAKIASIGLQIAFTKNLAPALTWLLNAFGKAAGVIRWFWSGMISGAKNNAKIVVSAFQWIMNAGQNTWSWMKGAIGWLKNAFVGVGKFLVSPFVNAFNSIKGFINGIIDAINVVLGAVGADKIGHVGGGGGAVNPGGTNVGQAVTGAKKKGKKKQTGGVMVPGQGLGDKVAALLEPGEFVLNRKAVAAIGLGELNRFNKAIPRFQSGGGANALVNPAGAAANAVGSMLSGGGMPKLPGVGGLPGWIQPVGQFVLDKVGGFIKNKVTGLFGGHTGARGLLGKIPQDMLGMMQPGILNIAGTVMSRFPGLSVSSSFRPGDSGFHGSGRAVDLSSGDYKLMNTAAGWIAANMTGILTEGIHNPNLSVKYGRHVDPGFWGAATWGQHLNHIHLAKQRGGEIFGGGSLNKNQLTTLAAYVGMANPALMAAIAMAESSGIPTRRGGAGEYGLWQILPSTADAFGIPKGNLLDPIKNARGAAKILKGQGLGAWTTYTSGAYQNFLGGKVKPGLLARLKGVTGGVAPGTTGKTTAKKKGKDAGQDALSVPQDIQDIMQAYYDNLQVAVDTENERRSSLNDLYSSANLSALQGYQVAASQSPLVGLSAPGVPSLYSMLDMLPNAPEAPDLSSLSTLADINTAAVNAFLVSQGQAPTGIYGSPGRGATPRRRHTAPAIHNHFYVDGKEIQGITQVAMRKASRRGRRRLPSAGA